MPPAQTSVRLSSLLRLPRSEFRPPQTPPPSPWLSSPRARPSILLSSVPTAGWPTQGSEDAGRVRGGRGTRGNAARDFAPGEGPAWGQAQDTPGTRRHFRSALGGRWGDRRSRWRLRKLRREGGRFRGDGGPVCGEQETVPERPAKARPRGSGRPREGFAFRHVEGSGGQVGAELRNLQPPWGRRRRRPQRREADGARRGGPAKAARGSPCGDGGRGGGADVVRTQRPLTLRQGGRGTSQ